MGNLFQELKRRKVFRVAAVYAIVAWLIIQVAGELLPTFHAPEWVNQTIVLVLLLGFPLALVLAWAFEITPEGIKTDAAVQPAQSITQSTDRNLIYAILALVLLVAGFQIGDRFLFEPQTSAVAVGTANTAPSPVSNLSRRFLINLGITLPNLAAGTRADIALSPDGRRLVYSVQRADVPPQLYLQELDQLESQLLTEDSYSFNPFFSLDGEWIGFSLGNVLNKISIRGGAAQPLQGSALFLTGGFWSSDDTIFYTSLEGGLQRIAADGGVPEPLDIVRDSADFIHSWPHLLPGGDALLYTISHENNARDGKIGLLTISAGEVRTLIQSAYNARYVSTGHIVFMRSASLWAVPFDLERLETTGPEVPVIQGVQTEGDRGGAAYAFSNDGLLVYLPGEDTSRNRELSTLVWVDRGGNEETLSERRDFRVPVVSPDGQKLAVVVVVENTNENIWIYDLARNTLSRLTFDEAHDYNPLWTPDGERIVFRSEREDGGLWWRSADGTGQAEPLLTGIPNARPNSFTPDGSQLVYDVNGDLYLLTLDSDFPPQTLIQTEFREEDAHISSDGRWITYSSNETGRDEIYVRPFPDVEAGKWQISNEGGRSPKWSANGRELIFRGLPSLASSIVWVAQVETETSFQYETPNRLITFRCRPGACSRAFDISADGSRFLLLRGDTIDRSELTQLIAVDNWFEELKLLAPSDPQ